MDDERFRDVMDRLYRRLDVLRRSSELLPETDYELGFYTATESELTFLSDMIADLETL
jgi:hypothetical protein